MPTTCRRFLRPPLSGFARAYILFIALAPFFAGTLVGAALGEHHAVGGAGVMLLPVGLLLMFAVGEILYLRRQRLLRAVWAAIILIPAIVVVATTFMLPWVMATSVKTAIPCARARPFLRRQLSSAAPASVCPRLPAIPISPP